MFRRQVYSYAAFWPGILDNWRPRYTGQSILMFISYAFLHGGLIHLIINMMALISLAPQVQERAGERGLAVVYIASMLGGALGYALLKDGNNPMVGASGAIFGLAGAILLWEFVDRINGGGALRPVFKALGVLIALNVVLFLAVGGAIAWEAHLGGFLTGALVAYLRPSPLPD